MTQELLALAAQCEAESEPNRSIDYKLACWFNPGADVPHYTASIDAAMTLVPRGWIVELIRCFDDDGDYWTVVKLVDSFSVGRGRDDEERREESSRGSGDFPRFMVAAALRARAHQSEIDL